MLDFNNFSQELRLLYDWRISGLPAPTKNLLDKLLLETCNSYSQSALILNLISGNNLKKIKIFLSSTPGFEYKNSLDLTKIVNLNISLNNEQVYAVIHDIQIKPILILAGAGSGKTAVLTRKIILMLLLQVDVENIMALTFTNKAAEEMKNRIIGLLEDITVGIEDNDFVEYLNSISKKIGNLKVGTFHSICYELLTEFVDGKYNYERVGFKRQPAILESIKQQYIIQKLLDKFNITNFDANDVLEELGNAKSELILPDNFLKDGDCKKFKPKIFQKIYQEYQNILLDKNLMDFDDIILKTVVLLNDYKDISEYYSFKYNNFLIDEYQDTNFAQYVFALKIAGKHHNIFAVGDDDQSIYGWRGADIRNIRNFKKDFPESVILKFEKNYRSSQTIIKAANAVFKDKSPDERKILECGDKKDSFENIYIFEAIDEYDEVNFCAFEINREIKKLKEQSVSDIELFFNTKYDYINQILNQVQNQYQNLSDATMKGWHYVSDYINFYNEFLQNRNINTYYDFIDKTIKFNFNISADFSEHEKSLFEQMSEYLIPITEEMRKILYVYNKFSVFYRINSQKKVIKQILFNNKIPFIEVGDNEFFKYQEVQNLIYMFTLLAGMIRFYSGDIQGMDMYNEINNPLTEILKRPYFRLSSNDKSLLENQSPLLSVFEEAELNFVMENFTKIGKNSFLVIYNKMSEIINKLNRHSILDITNSFINLLGYDKEMLSGKKSGKLLENNIINFKSIVYDYQFLYKESGIKSINSFLKYLKYKQSDIQSELFKKNGVYLMTLHSAKGLEFDYVFFTGLEHGVCPYIYPGNKKNCPANEDEEKRLFYVGITRAKKVLYLTYCNYRKWFGKNKKMKPSKFLKLLPKNVVAKGSSLTLLQKILLTLKKIFS